MHVQPITIAEILLGLSIVAGGALVLPRSKVGAGFAAIGGLGYAAGGVVSLAMSVLTAGSPASREVVMILGPLISIARHAILYGGLILALRALAQSRELGR